MENQNKAKLFKVTRKEVLDILFRTLIVLLTNTLISFTTVFFLSPAHLYAGGATGLSQLIQGIVELFGGQINLGILIFIVNIPIALIGFKYVSKKFAIYSVLAIIIQSVITGLLEAYVQSPFIDMAKDIVINGTSYMNYGGILTLAIFGGLLAGAASGLALKYGVSTGGIDVISQALALHKNMSLGNITMIINIGIAIIGGGFIHGYKDGWVYGWTIVLFTIVRMILNSLVMDKIHTSYTFTALNIFTHKEEEISQMITIDFHRGCTAINAKGAYTHNGMTELYCVLSTYEVDRALVQIQKVDPKAFITCSPVKRIKGNFKKKTII